MSAVLRFDHRFIHAEGKLGEMRDVREPALVASMANQATALRFDPLRFTKRLITRAEMERLIAEAAYLRAAARHFAPGGEVEDWLVAEREVAERFMIAV